MSSSENAISEETPLLTSEAPSETSTVGMYQKVKDWWVEEYGRPQDEASNALVCSFMLYLAAISTSYGMTLIPGLYFTEDRFLNGSNDYGRDGLFDLCKEGKSILLALPATVSETLADADEVTHVLVGSFLTFSAILFLTSKIGSPSTFPLQAGHFRTIFNFLRMIIPVSATFFIPRVPAIGPIGFVTLGDKITTDYHIILAVISFLFSPPLELLSAGFDLYSFFTHKPFGDNFIVILAARNEESGKRNNIVATLYKTLWVALTTIRAVMAAFLIHLALAFFSVNAGTGDPQTDACGTLRTMKSLMLEVILAGLFAGMYGVLAVSQMCESSGRQISSLVYILPLLYFIFSGIVGYFSKYLLTLDMEANYLSLVGIPESGFWNITAEEYNGCTALLNLTSIPENCFELAKNPQ